MQRSPDGRVSFTLGDCAGHGLGAVAVMSTVRNAAHTLLLEGRSPGEVLTGTDRLLRSRRAGAMATAVHGQLDRDAGQLRIATAGHPPLLLVRDGVASYLELTTDPPLGAFALAGDDGRASTQTARVRSGDSLIAFTDGLIERRGESIDEGLAVLRTRTEQIWSETSDREERTDLLMALEYGSTNDDVCVLVVDV